MSSGDAQPREQSPIRSTVSALIARVMEGIGSDAEAPLPLSSSSSSLSSSSGSEADFGRYQFGTLAAGKTETLSEPDISNTDHVIDLVLQQADGTLTTVTAGAEWTVKELQIKAAIVTSTRLRCVKLVFDDEILADNSVELSDLELENDSIIAVHCVGGFEIGQRLEARDRRNPGLLCVASILDVKEPSSSDGNQQVLIHFDGWSETYDYWTDVATPDIAPCGTCSEIGEQLQKPHRLRFESWSSYLEENNYTPAPVEAFRLPEGEKYLRGDHLQRAYNFSWSQVMRTRAIPHTMPIVTYTSDVPFAVGQALEARDRRHTSYLCVATIIDIRAEGKEILIHFDGWGSEYDYWTNIGTPDIAPIGTCRSLGYQLEAPRGVPFNSWREYLTRENREATPVAAFQTEIPFFSNGPHKRLTGFTYLSS
eukprot:TRINITY_DN975_c0_g1_i1.p1 TRINITY_DN975_c0_g1~~TRINITY_DN975_c0_g1_i1.p1  ORF type:complete len:443 (+),score=68.99 TRINITY_DN975_c0_g1_i1:59-1330(+)